MTRFFYVVMLFLLVQTAMAQSYRNGFIRLKDGQEITGLIGDMVPGDPAGIQFKTELAGELKIYLATEIEGYGIVGGFFYSSFKNPGPKGDWDFVELLVKGELTLIRSNNMFFIHAKGESQISHLPGSAFISILMKMMKNCPYVAAQTVRVKLNTFDLTTHVQAFNDCIAIKNPNYDNASRKVSIALVGGYDFTSCKFRGDDDQSSRYLASGKLYDRSFVQFGADITIRSYRLSSSVGLYTGAYFNSNSYTALTKMSFRNGESEVNEFSIDYKELKIPLGFEYSPPTRSPLSYFIRIALTFPKVLSVKSKHISQEIRSKNGDVYYFPPSDVSDISKMVQVGGGVGLDYRIYKNSRIRLQANYAVGGGSAELKVNGTTRTNDGSFQSFNAMAGFVF
jgi:hypothetical protein